MKDNGSGINFLVELKDLTSKERRVALRIAKTSRVSARRYAHTVLENRRLGKTRRPRTASVRSIKEGDLRRFIRQEILTQEIDKTNREAMRHDLRYGLGEQVVGYKAPQEKDSDGGGYLSMGDMGVDTTLSDQSTDEEQASADQVRTLTQQRQQDLDQGKTVDAQNVGQQLGMARRTRG